MREDYNKNMAEGLGELHTQWSTQYQKPCICPYNNTADEVISHAKTMRALYDEGDGQPLFVVVLRPDVGPELWSEEALRKSLA